MPRKGKAGAVDARGLPSPRKGGQGDPARFFRFANKLIRIL